MENSQVVNNMLLYDTQNCYYLFVIFVSSALSCSKAIPLLIKGALSAFSFIKKIEIKENIHNKRYIRSKKERMNKS